VAAATACESLKFGHWIQSSTQATNTERAGQVPYSRGKAMADSALSRMENLPVTIASLGLLYCKEDGVVGQSGHGLNLIDIAMLPLTPIMGTGTAPMQPQEIMDAAERIAFLAFSDPAARPMQKLEPDVKRKESKLRSFTFRFYDAVGPEELSILELLEKFAYYRGVKNFRPVHVGYRNFEMLLNIKSLGNLNRQFVSLLRSEQHGEIPLYGNPKVWASLLGEGSTLTTLDEAFAPQCDLRSKTQNLKVPPRYPISAILRMVFENPRVIKPGLALLIEMLSCYYKYGSKLRPQSQGPKF